MKIPRSELPVITAAVNAAPVKAVPDLTSGPAAVADAAAVRPQGDGVAPVPARADIGNWPDPM
ncbi:hypothetical protein ACFRAU_02050 [Arthrobacter sp. NPDC056691]|uniref:hypothetical protein n=1 Tax=unclassified Arthrobacter TaxID=235627 RepID=UPI00366C6928